MLLPVLELLGMYHKYLHNIIYKLKRKSFSFSLSLNLLYRVGCKGKKVLLTEKEIKKQFLRNLLPYQRKAPVIGQ